MLYFMSWLKTAASTSPKNFPTRGDICEEIQRSITDKVFSENGCAKMERWTTTTYRFRVVRYSQNETIVIQ